MTATVLIATNEDSTFRRRLAALLPELPVVTCRPWDLAAHSLRAAVLVVDGAVVDDTLLRLAPRLRLVQVLGPRLDEVDLAACGRRGVLVAGVPWGNRAGEPGPARL